MVRAAVTGATGRMGREVLAAADERDLEVVLALARHPEDSVGGTAVENASDLADLLAERDPDVLIDFTAPDSSVEYVEAAADAGVAAVVGTTGFDDDQIDRLRAASERVAVLRAANFSRGVRALLAAVREATDRLPGYDVEVTETHHSGKRDAPSGTAKTLVSAVEEVRGGGGRGGGDAEQGHGDAERVHGREGHAPRETGEIGVHARRAGGVSGEHEVLLAGDHELLSLTHRAGDRGVFAEGALDAAEWLSGREPGWYEFDDVVGGGSDDVVGGGSDDVVGGGSDDVVGGGSE